MAGWAGCRLKEGILAARAELLEKVLPATASKLHADDTPVPVLPPGQGKVLRAQAPAPNA